MLSGEERALVIVSVKQGWPAHLCQVCRDIANLTIQAISDPRDLRRRLVPPTRPGRDSRVELTPPRPVGIVVDLTGLDPRRSDLARPRDSRGSACYAVTCEAQADLAWCVGALLAIGRCMPSVPLVTVSETAHSAIRAAMLEQGIQVAACLGLDTEDLKWRALIAALMEECIARCPQGPTTVAQDVRHSAETPTCGVRMRANLWFDPPGCALHSGHGDVRLTARECRLLTMLAGAPGQYLRTNDIARRLLRPGAEFAIDEHSVEQTIAGLRRKLGENGRHAQLIRTCYGIGYGLFVES